MKDLKVSCILILLNPGLEFPILTFFEIKEQHQLFVGHDKPADRPVYTFGTPIP